MRLTRRGPDFVFLPTYVLAMLGAHIGFMPLLVLLLPRRVEAIATHDKIALLSWLLLGGALVASVAHIAAGHLSDRWFARHGRRRGMIAIGLGALVAAYALLAVAQSIAMLAVAVVAFQAALNLMFAPLGALLADHVVDRNKGLTSGLLNLALPMSGVVVTVIGLWSRVDAAWPFLVVAALIAIAVAPLLLAWPAGLELVPAARGADAATPVAEVPVGDRGLIRNFVFAFVARMLIQLGAAVVLSYLYFYVEAIAHKAAHFTPASVSGGVGILSLIATAMSLVAGVAGGRASDVFGRRRVPLMIAAVVCAGSLAGLAMAGDWRLIVASYAGFVAALTVFLSIDAAMVAQMIGHDPRRGALLGLMNLTNTLPSVAAPAMTLVFGGLFLSSRLFEGLLWTSAAAALIAAGAMAMVRLR